MKISADEVLQIATLARLELTSDEVPALQRDLGTILEHIRDLERVDTEGLTPMGGVSEHVAPMRSDERGADPLHLPLGEIAPAVEEGLFLVPRLAALDADAPADAGGHA